MAHSHGEKSCNCVSSSRGVQQTIDEMEFERGIWTAAMENDLDRVEKFICQGKVNARDNFGYTALHYAARKGLTAMCELLLRNGAEVDCATSAGGVTPLQRASTRGCLNVVRLLVEKGRADVKLRDADGKTALHRAVEERHRSVAQFLFQKDPSLVDSEDNQKKTPRNIAAGIDEMKGLFE